ncbi:MAG: 7-carboxy-7-deazaguanine synthase QueE [Alphaproteobacteria bacterium]|nr:7-carboxy-7-deazaguanine synthase QueE [Alphaproteobacteria bacterium]
MLGTNPKRSIEVSEGRFLKVQDIFLTIQGEGPYSGRGAIFIRLGGCNLACKFCDTEFDSFKEHSVDYVINQVEQKTTHNVVKFVVITGGEPFRQSINYLCQELLNRGYEIQIETNGSIYQKIPDNVSVVCSPKIHGGKYHKVRPELNSHIIAYKFLISSNIEFYNNVPDWDFRETPIYVQPIDEYSEEVNEKNNMLAVDIAIQKGYILSSQIHKIIGIK